MYIPYMDYRHDQGDLHCCRVQTPIIGTGHLGYSNLWWPRGFREFSNSPLMLCNIMLKWWVLLSVWATLTRNTIISVGHTDMKNGAHWYKILLSLWYTIIWLVYAISVLALVVWLQYTYCTACVATDDLLYISNFVRSDDLIIAQLNCFCTNAMHCQHTCITRTCYFLCDCRPTHLMLVFYLLHITSLTVL